MSQDSSEEKALPPSDKKLRDAREKGQIATSRDMVSAMTMIFLMIYLLFAWPSIARNFGQMFEIAGRMAMENDSRAWTRAAQGVWDEMAEIVLPFMALSGLAILLGAVISNRGIVFSFHPLKPDLKRIHPVEGFKKLFSLRNLIEFGKSLVKSMLLLGALGFSAWYALDGVVRAPFCGADCLGDAFEAAIIPLIILALMLFAASGLLDLTLQKWLFTRDMRMTHTEMKRERKEMYGDPTVRGQRNQIRRDIATGADGPKLSSRKPTLLFASDDGETAVALRYVGGETPAPVMVAKGNGVRAGDLLQAASASGVPIVRNQALTELLLRRGRMLSFIPEAAFKDVALALNQHNVLR